MRIFQIFSTSSIKFFKGLFIIACFWLLAATSIFVFDSCSKAKYESSIEGEAAKKFNSALKQTKGIISSISLVKENSIQARATVDDGNYYVDFPAGTAPEVFNDFMNNPTIQQLNNALQAGATLNDTLDAEYDLVINIPQEQIVTALNPLIVEARNYLVAKGATQQQITEMIQEEGAEEIDLIPFVKTLTAIEQDQYVVRNFSIPFVNEANAFPRALECGIQALGFDAAYALAHSGASSWTWSTMKSVFKGVAKRFLGPIGVAIAVVEFTMCML